MLLFLIIFFELEVVRPLSLGDFLCKSSKSSFCGHAEARRKTYQLKFAISGVHLGKIFRVWSLNSGFGFFPYIENSSHKTVYVQCSNVLIIAFQLDNLFIETIWIFSLKNITGFAFIWPVFLFMTKIGLYSRSLRTLVKIHHHTWWRLINRRLFLNDVVAKFRSFLEPMNQGV